MSSQTQSDVVIGPRRLGRYELIAKIAAGGMAEVFLAHQHGLMGFQKVVVVKTIHEHLARQQDFIDMFLDEARVSALIKHHNVVDIYDLGVDDGTYFIAMEYIPGQALSKVMSLCQRTEPLDTMVTIDLLARAANGLDAAHNLTDISGEPLELVHRDVSPGNILVSYNGAVKLVDFGVAKSLASISSSQASVLKGKIGYASPEQLEDRGIDRRSDIFSLGIVLWEALVFQRLFSAGSAGATVKKILETDPPPPSSERAEVPPEVDEICLKALARDPDERYQTAGEMRAALQSVLQANNYHSDQDELAKFMKKSFARERARERALISQIAETTDKDKTKGDDEPAGKPPATGTRARRKSRPPSIAGIVAEPDGPPDPDMTVDLPLVGSGLLEDDGEEELEISVEPAPETGTGTGTGTETGPRLTSQPPKLVARSDSGHKVRLVAGAIIAVAVLSVVVLLATRGDSKTSALGSEDRGEDRGQPSDQVKPPVPADAAPAPRAVDAAAPVVVDAAPPPDAPEPSEADRITQLGDDALRRGRTRDAKAFYREALKHQDDYAPALRGLALLYARVGRGKQARYYLNKYLRAAPNAPDAASLRRRVYSSTR